MGEERPTVVKFKAKEEVVGLSEEVRANGDIEGKGKRGT